MTAHAKQKHRADAPLVHASAVNDYDLARIRADFPILARQVHGKPLIYLDNAASAQKPRGVIDTIAQTYAEDYSNVHRGLHYLSGRATDLYEGARETVRGYIGAAEARQIVFTKGATEAINLVAATFGESRIGEGDEIILSELEHHANIVPWQMLAQRKGAVIKVAKVEETTELTVDAVTDLITDRTRLIALTAISNAVGTRTPLGRIVAAARQAGVPTLIDGTQAVVHGPVDVDAMGCDFFVFSGHKVYGPTGIGVLYARGDWLDRLPPYQTGGEMIRTVSFEAGTSFAEPPAKFEAGTPPIVPAIGLAAAIDYLATLGIEKVAAHEADLLAYGTERLSAIDGVSVFGNAPDKASIISFTVDGIHPHDIGTLIDHHGIAIRAGHHCAQPLLQRFDLPATARASLGLYNSRAEIDRLADALEQVMAIFA